MLERRSMLAGLAALPAAGLPIATLAATRQADPFTNYGAEVVALHEAMSALPPDAPDADSDAFMDRWGAIDAEAMAGQPTTFAGAAGALEYARREFVQFHVEPREDGGREIDPGDKLILHLIDGAIAVLRRAAGGGVA